MEYKNGEPPKCEVIFVWVLSADLFGDPGIDPVKMRFDLDVFYSSLCVCDANHSVRLGHLSHQRFRDLTGISFLGIGSVLRKITSF